MLVSEYNAKLWVNLTDYLDTGLFLDHRIARQMLGKMSQAKISLTCLLIPVPPAFMRGWAARSTTTVDMSRTYLEWAEELASEWLDGPATPLNSGGLPFLAQQH